MITSPVHNRKLALGGVAFTKAKFNKNNGKALDIVGDEVEKVIIDAHFLEGAALMDNYYHSNCISLFCIRTTYSLFTLKCVENGRLSSPICKGTI